MLYLTFRRFDEALLIMATLPFALVGGVWFLYLLNYHLSVPAGIGFIALAGVSAEFCVVLLFFLNMAAASRPDSVRSDERRVGIVCVIKGRHRRSTYYAHKTMQSTL